VFDLFYTDPAQVVDVRVHRSSDGEPSMREFLIAMAKSGLVAGVYLWINRVIDGPRPAMIDERRSSTIDPEGRMSALAVNGKMYVGSSINLYSRMSRYFAVNSAHGIIGKALLKYGLVSFIDGSPRCLAPCYP